MRELFELMVSWVSTYAQNAKKNNEEDKRMGLSYEKGHRTEGELTEAQTLLAIQRLTTLPHESIWAILELQKLPSQHQRCAIADAMSRILTGDKELSELSEEGFWSQLETIGRATVVAATITSPPGAQSLTTQDYIQRVQMKLESSDVPHEAIGVVMNVMKDIEKRPPGQQLGIAKQLYEHVLILVGMRNVCSA